MSTHPFHPQGFGQHGFYSQPPDTFHPTRGTAWPPAVGKKHWNPAYGRRIRFVDLPPDCQRAVMQDYVALWDLEA